MTYDWQREDEVSAERTIRIPSYLWEFPISDLWLYYECHNLLEAAHIETLGDLHGLEWGELASVVHLRGSLREHLSVKLTHLVRTTHNPHQKLHLAIDEGLQRDPRTFFLEDLGLSRHTFEILQEIGLETVHDLCRYTREQLLQLEGFGQYDLADLLSSLTTLGFPPHQYLRSIPIVSASEAILRVLRSEGHPMPLAALISQASQIPGVSSESRLTYYRRLTRGDFIRFDPGIYGLPAQSYEPGRIRWTPAEYLERALREAGQPMEATALIRTARLLPDAPLASKEIYYRHLLEDIRFKRQALGIYALREWNIPQAEESATPRARPNFHFAPWGAGLTLRLPAQSVSPSSVAQWIIRSAQGETQTVSSRPRRGLTEEVFLPLEGPGEWEAAFEVDGVRQWSHVLSLPADSPLLFKSGSGHISKQAAGDVFVFVPSGWSLHEGMTLQELPAVDRWRIYEAHVSEHSRLALRSGDGHVWDSRSEAVSLDTDHLVPPDLLEDADGVPIYTQWPTLRLRIGWSGKLTLRGPDQSTYSLNVENAALQGMEPVPGLYSLVIETPDDVPELAHFRLWPAFSLQQHAASTRFFCHVPEGFEIAAEGLDVARDGDGWSLRLRSGELSGELFIRESSGDTVSLHFKPPVTCWKLQHPSCPTAEWTRKAYLLDETLLDEGLLWIDLPKAGGQTVIMLLGDRNEVLLSRYLKGGRRHALRLSEFDVPGDLPGLLKLAIRRGNESTTLGSIRRGWWPEQLTLRSGPSSGLELAWEDTAHTGMRRIVLRCLTHPWKPRLELVIPADHAGALSLPGDLAPGQWEARCLEQRDGTLDFYGIGKLKEGLRKVLHVTGPDPGLDLSPWQARVARETSAYLSQRRSTLDIEPPVEAADVADLRCASEWLLTDSGIDGGLQEAWRLALNQVPMDRLLDINPELLFQAGLGQAEQLFTWLGEGPEHRTIEGLEILHQALANSGPCAELALWQQGWQPLSSGALSRFGPRHEQGIMAHFKDSTDHLSVCFLEFYERFLTNSGSRMVLSAWANHAVHALRPYRHHPVLKHPFEAFGQSLEEGGLEALPFAVMAIAALEREFAGQSERRDARLALLSSEAYRHTGALYPMALLWWEETLHPSRLKVAGPSDERLAIEIAEPSPQELTLVIPAQTEPAPGPSFEQPAASALHEQLQSLRDTLPGRLERLVEAHKAFVAWREGDPTALHHLDRVHRNVGLPEDSRDLLRGLHAVLGRLARIRQALQGKALFEAVKAARAWSDERQMQDLQRRIGLDLGKLQHQYQMASLQVDTLRLRLGFSHEMLPLESSLSAEALLDRRAEQQEDEAALQRAITTMQESQAALLSQITTQLERIEGVEAILNRQVAGYRASVARVLEAHFRRIVAAFKADQALQRSLEDRLAAMTVAQPIE